MGAAPAEHLLLAERGLGSEYLADARGECFVVGHRQAVVTRAGPEAARRHPRGGPRLVQRETANNTMGEDDRVTISLPWRLPPALQRAAGGRSPGPSLVGDPDGRPIRHACPNQSSATADADMPGQRNG